MVVYGVNELVVVMVCEVIMCVGMKILGCWVEFFLFVSDIDVDLVSDLFFCLVVV